ncbi:tyrosine-type recombinase/integrase [Sulfurimonas sp.]|uniref:tyrosine-type recombinase/integrase n=2 Tax=Sulfurimonas sp. TaxID=2022749 RepID=UPI002606E202|nr:tyrosine-type recombinase/integrase [Sulfurimonas sp.]MDD5158182.1 tyrosine-type recombinase/integrase [Sulfurimonas sp.]
MKIYIKKVKDSNDEIKEWIWIRFTHQGKNYRKTLGLLNTKANMKLAKNEIMPTMQLKLYSGELFEKIVPTIDEYSKKSFEIHSVSRKKTTQDDYRISYDKHIKPYLGERKIDSLKPSDISLWQNKVLNSVSASRMKVVRAVLSTILNDALRDEIIERNPLVLVRTPKITKPTISPFSLSEIFSILNNAEEQFKNFFALAFFTGMRSGEMIGLKWENVDFFRKEIYVKQALKMGQVTTPKTVNSVRYVDIVDTLLPYLQMQFRLTGHHKSYVFLNDDNEHFYDIKRIRTTHWKRVLKKCNFEYRPIYHTRHTFATLMLENGEDILWVSNMLGHTDSTMTLSRYAKYIKRDEKKRATFLENRSVLNSTETTPSIQNIG